MPTSYVLGTVIDVGNIAINMTGLVLSLELGKTIHTE